MWDKRRKKRMRLLYYLKVYNEDELGILGRLIDISREGLLVLCNRLVESNTQLKLKLTLPSEYEGQKNLHLTAESVWCKKDLRHDGFNVGFRILNPSAETLEIIDFATQEHAFRE